MALTREDLETFIKGKPFASNADARLLMLAAPKLALAALDAISGLEPHIKPCLELTELRKALEAAGVEVPDGD